MLLPDRPTTQRRLCQLGVALLAFAALPACADEVPKTCPVPPGSVCVVAGTGDLGFNKDGVSATQTDLYLPSAARRGADGLTYVMDFNNQRLRRIEEDGRMDTVVGDGFHALAMTGVPVLDTPLENPIDFAFLSDGRIVIASYHDPRVLVWDSDDTLRSIAGAGEVGMDGNEGDGADALDALFIQLDGIEVGPDDTVYVSDSKAHRVRRIRDGVIDTIAGTGEPEYSGDGGPGVEAGLHWPTALALDPDGNLLIADARNHVVRSLDEDGIIRTIAGTGVQGYSGDGGSALDAELNQPTGLALGEDGTLYIGDRANFVVRMVTPDGTIETLAGTGEEGATGDGGPARDATFGYIARVYLDGDGLFVADQSSSLIRRITLP